MNDETRTLASEVIGSVMKEKREIIDRVDFLTVDLEKAMFCIDSAGNTLSKMKEPKTRNDALVQYLNTRSVQMSLNIVVDYLEKIQSNIREIVAEAEQKNNEILEQGDMEHLYTKEK